jgi:hypothetical protein
MPDRRYAPSGYPFCTWPGCRTLGTYPGDRCGRHDRRDLPQLELDLQQQEVSA